MSVPSGDASLLTAAEAQAIAKDAYIYGFSVVDNYRIQYSYFVDTADPEYKASWNHLVNTPRVYTPDDKAIQTPNSDTPYSFVGMDLRTEPLVLTLPPIAEERYFSVQFIDAYTFNFAYLGSRATGNAGGLYLVAGPEWKGSKPDGIQAVIRSETQFVFALIRTQLFNPEDLDEVKNIQAGYKVQPLSQYLGQPAPPAAPRVNFLKPLSAQQEHTLPEFFNILNFALQFCPTHPSEIGLMERFAKLGIGAGHRFSVQTLPPEIQQAVHDGMADAWKAFAEHKATKIDTGLEGSGDAFGTRDFLGNDYMKRMSGAVLGIYGNSKDEALYPVYFTDSTGEKLDGENRYQLRFGPGELPPVNAFWSLTMYELPASLLVKNPIDRYLINSPMLPSLKRDADGGITVYVQNRSPGPALESNWLPAPIGPFFCGLRLYWPKAEAIDGKWAAPKMVKAA